MSTLTETWVRPAELSDAAAVAWVQAESWRATYRGQLPDAVVDAYSLPRQMAWWGRILGRSERETVLVAETGDGPAGMASGGPSRGGPAGLQGEIQTLYVLPSVQGCGIGRALFERMREELQGTGHRGLIVWALASNAPARAFYRHLGGRLVARRPGRMGGAAIEEVAYGWPA
jgi:GNAT superfamily N-acetyltransferase